MSDLGVLLVSSYPPRRCGLATFTSDLSRSLALQPGVHVHMVAIDAPDEALPYGRNVIGRIRQEDEESYRRAAERVRACRADVVCVEHEFGLWGSWDIDSGDLVEDYTATLIEAVEALPRPVPVVTTLHTIRPNPRPGEQSALGTIIERSAATIVMARTAAMILMDDYEVSGDTIVRIAHGVPVVDRHPRRFFKRQLGLEGRTIISTVGLLDPRKGIEYAIAALPLVIERHPHALYLIVGETHPEYRKRCGEQYRNELRALVRELGLQDHVSFVNQYLSDRDLVSYLQASDIYVTPYLDRNQITSGTLAFAVGTGRAIISTPYPHATEALAEGRGLLAEFRSAESLAHCLLLMLDSPDLRAVWEQRTAEYGKRDAWPLVGACYADLLRRVVARESYGEMLAIQPEPLSVDAPLPVAAGV